MKTVTTFSLPQKNSVAGVIAVFMIVAAVLACGGSKTPPPAGYVGSWTGADGTTLTIRADGSGDYKSGNSSVDNGGVAVDEAAKTLKISFAGIGPSWTIDKPPSGDQMTLSGVVYKKGGGSSSSESKADTSTSTGKLDVPGKDKLQTLAKETFLDFSDAVQNDDFTDFHKKVAKVWRDSSTPDEMADAFKTFVDHKESYNFKKAVSGLDATFDPAPVIDKVQGLDALILKGYYPTKPEQANFELKYTMDDASWKLIGINIKTTRQ